MEGIPNSLIEAMSMELPVVSTRHSGIPELVEETINGFLVEERDIDDFSQKMYDAVSLNRLPRNREKVRQSFEMNLHNIKLNEFYHSILDG
jgi:colanic acid/amylovoran biosynthesis glycosyltransferase